MRYRFLHLWVLLCLLSLPVQADDTIPDPRITTRVQMVGIGRTNLLDTYLSPEKYSGTELRYISNVTRERPDNPWSRQTDWQGYLSFTDNRADNNNMMAGLLTFSYGQHYRWLLMDNRLDLRVGALIDARLGFIYNTRNTNNPAQAKAALSLCPSGIATYRFTLGNRPMAVRYELAAPLLGLMFSPNYGQSYYEIFSEGNYDHNIVATTSFNTPSLRQMLSLDFPLGRFTLRMGYLGDYQQAKANQLKYHVYSHMLVVGVVRKFTLTDIIP